MFVVLVESQLLEVRFHTRLGDFRRVLNPRFPKLGANLIQHAVWNVGRLFGLQLRQQLAQMIDALVREMNVGFGMNLLFVREPGHAGFEVGLVHSASIAHQMRLVDGDGHRMIAFTTKDGRQRVGRRLAAGRFLLHGDVIVHHVVVLLVQLAALVSRFRGDESVHVTLFFRGST